MPEKELIGESKIRETSTPPKPTSDVGETKQKNLIKEECFNPTYIVDVNSSACDVITTTT